MPFPFSGSTLVSGIVSGAVSSAPAPASASALDLSASGGCSTVVVIVATSKSWLNEYGRSKVKADTLLKGGIQIIFKESLECADEVSVAGEFR